MTVQRKKRSIKRRKRINASTSTNKFVLCPVKVLAVVRPRVLVFRCSWVQHALVVLLPTPFTLRFSLVNTIASTLPSLRHTFTSSNPSVVNKPSFIEILIVSDTLTVKERVVRQRDSVCEFIVKAAAVASLAKRFFFLCSENLFRNHLYDADVNKS